MIANLETPVTAPLQPPADDSVSSLIGSELKRLVLHSSHYLVGLVGSLALGLISFPIFTRVFSVADYGVIDLAQKVALLLMVVSKGGLQNAVVRFYDGKLFAADRDAARQYYSTMVFGVAANSAAVGLLFGAVILVAPYFIDIGPLAPLVYFISALALLRAVSAILWAFLRVEERTVAFNAVSVGLRAATIAVVCLLLLYVGGSAKSFFSGVVFTEFALVAGLLYWLVQRGLLHPGSFDMTFFKGGVLFGFPLVLYEFGFTALGSADRFLVQSYLGAEALGLYSVAYGLSQHVNELLLGPLTLALSPIYMKLWMEKGSARTAGFLSFALDVFLAAAFCILAMATVASHDVVVLLASAKYAGADHLIPWLLAGLLVYATHIFIVAGLMIHKKTMKMATLLAIAAVFNIALNCLLLPVLGLLGGAFATVLSYVFCIVLLVRASRQYLPLNISLPAIAKYSTAAVAAWLVGSHAGFGPLLVDLVARCAVTLAVYCGVLYGLDPRVRRLVADARLFLEQRA